MGNSRAEITVTVHRCLENPKIARTNGLRFQAKGAAREQAFLSKGKLNLSFYREVAVIEEKENTRVLLVQHVENRDFFVKKFSLPMTPMFTGCCRHAIFPVSLRFFTVRKKMGHLSSSKNI